MPVCFSLLWYGCLGATAARADASFVPRPITEFTWTVRSMFSQTESEHVCKWRTSVVSLSNMCQDQFSSKRSGGNSIPPSPGDESSVFWRENQRAASVLSTTVDITQPVCQVYRKVLKVFSPRVQHKVKVSLFRHPKYTIKVLNWEHYDYYSGAARVFCSGPTLTVLKQKSYNQKWSKTRFIAQ